MCCWPCLRCLCRRQRWTCPTWATRFAVGRDPGSRSARVPILRSTPLPRRWFQLYRIQPQGLTTGLLAWPGSPLPVAWRGEARRAAPGTGAQSRARPAISARATEPDSSPSQTRARFGGPGLHHRTHTPGPPDRTRTRTRTRTDPAPRTTRPHLHPHRPCATRARTWPRPRIAPAPRINRSNPCPHHRIGPAPRSPNRTHARTTGPDPRPTPAGQARAPDHPTDLEPPNRTHARTTGPDSHPHHRIGPPPDLRPPTGPEPARHDCADISSHQPVQPRAGAQLATERPRQASPIQRPGEHRQKLRLGV
ncbi:hypothetical protein H4W33_000741 [Kibdelosporangium phytohabitans]|nr:hypothetical protein [Kibdelosporangium phytohabitans]